MVHLTYAGLHRGELTFDSLLAAARGWGNSRDGLLEYVFGREKHSQPARPDRDEHFHIFLHFGKKVQLSNRRTTTVFDLRGQGGRTLHPEVQSVGRLPGDRQRVIEYDQKDGDWRGEIRTQLVRGDRQAARVQAGSDDDGSDSDDDDGERSPPKPRWAHRLKEASSVRDGMQRLYEESPAVYFAQGSRIQPMLVQAISSPDERLFTLADFNRPALELSLPVVLHGRTNTGKSEFAEAHFDAPIVVRTRDDLKRATFFCDGIIFDDFDFTGWRAEEIIHLLSINKSRSLPARYSDARIEAYTPIIFTTNKKPKAFFPRATSREQRRAIRRRYIAVKVTAPLQQLGRPFSAAEMQSRRSAGQNGPRGPPQRRR